MDRVIILTAFGEANPNEMIDHLRIFTDCPICVYIERDDYGPIAMHERVDFHIVELKWPDHPRCYHRNSDYYRIKALQESSAQVGLYLDLDIRIVDPASFMDGFKLAERFGCCLPINPRSFAGIDASIGADPDGSPPIWNATACSMGVIFASLKASGFFSSYLRIMEASPARGPAVMNKTIWETDFTPYFLPQEWCMSEAIDRVVTGTDYRIKPIAVHCNKDRPEMLEYYKQWIKP